MISPLMLVVEDKLHISFTTFDLKIFQLLVMIVVLVGLFPSQVDCGNGSPHTHHKHHRI
jgi:hypothetical protein